MIKDRAVMNQLFTAPEQLIRELPGAAEKGNFFIKRRDQRPIRKHSGDSDFPKAVLTELRRSARG